MSVRLVAHSRICEACDILGLPRPAEHSDQITIKISPFGGGEYAAPIFMREDWTNRSVCRELPESIPCASEAGASPAS